MADNDGAGSHAPREHVIAGRSQDEAQREFDEAIAYIEHEKVAAALIPSNMTSRSPSFTCPKCGMVSHNPNDVLEGYCGNCHKYTARPTNRTVNEVRQLAPPPRLESGLCSQCLEVECECDVRVAHGDPNSVWAPDGWEEAIPDTTGWNVKEAEIRKEWNLPDDAYAIMIEHKQDSITFDVDQIVGDVQRVAGLSWTECAFRMPLRSSMEGMMKDLGRSGEFFDDVEIVNSYADSYIQVLRRKR